MVNFEAEMYRFADDRRERARYVNVLHLGTDLGAARPEMDRIVESMKNWGYVAKIKPDLILSNDRKMLLACSDTDVLVLGSDAARHASADYVLRCMRAGWFGIVPHWDVLWYGADSVTEPHTEQPKPHAGRVSQPLYSGRKFALDGICLVHSHIRRRDDEFAMRGAYVSMLREIEGYINGLVKNAWKINSMDEKFKAFKDKVTNDGHSGSDVRLFFAALDILRNSRNAGVHLVRGLPPAQVKKRRERSEKLAADFDMLANAYNRPLWPPIVSSLDDSHLINKWEFGVAHMAATWLEEYSRLPADP